MDTFIIKDDYNGHIETHSILAYNALDAIQLWGKQHGGYYGSILSVEKL